MATPNNNPDGSIAGIPYEEAPGSGNFSISENGGSGQRVFYVDWANRIAFAEALAGETVEDEDPDNPNAYATDPQEFPGVSALKVSSVSVEPYSTASNDNGNPAYKYARITATYSPKPEENDEVIAEQQMNLTSEFYEYEEFKLFWAGDKPTGTNVHRRKLLPEYEHTFTENNVPNLLKKKSLADGRIGKINSSEYQGVSAGRLLYMGFTARRQLTADGRQPWQITHKFIERPDASWNKYYNGNSGEYETVYDENGDVYQTYETVSMNGLLEVD
jgi:hypothetical protein